MEKLFNRLRTRAVNNNRLFNNSKQFLPLCIVSGGRKFLPLPKPQSVALKAVLMEQSYEIMLVIFNNGHSAL